MDALAVATLIAATFPAGTVAGGVNLNLINNADGSVAASQTATADGAALSASATFTGVAPGTYTISAQRVDGSGAALGSAATSSPFTVAAPTDVSVTVPSSVAVTLQ